MQQKFVSFEKRSKKEKRRLNAQKRGSWGALNPVTRKPQNPKAYNRKKVPKIRKDDFWNLFLLENNLHWSGGARSGSSFSFGGITNMPSWMQLFTQRAGCYAV